MTRESEEVVRVPPANGQRRFLVFNVGLLKTGTTSIAALFGRFRSAHEALAVETNDAFDRRERGLLGSAEFRRFLRRRDLFLELEVDSAGFHEQYIQDLVELFPRAKFILTLRDCYSWLDSLLTYLLNDRADGGAFVGVGRERMGLPFDLPYRDAHSRHLLRRSIADHLDALVDYWDQRNRAVLEAVPDHRLLVVETHRLTSRIPQIAAFVGVPTDALDSGASHQLEATVHERLLEQLDRSRLEALFARVADPLMARYFPDLSLDRFLEQARRRTATLRERSANQPVVTID